MSTPRLTAGKNGAVLRVRVQPRARRAGFEGYHGDLLKVALTAPPVEGAANEALVRFLADALDVPPSTVCVISGQTSREKAVEFRGLDLATASDRLTALLSERAP